MEIEKNKILITGASGLLGKQLIYELNRRGVKPVAHVRETSDTSYVDSLGLEKRHADLRNEEGLEKLVDGIDAVIHTAAWVNFRQDRLTQFTGINTFGALNIFRAAQKAGVKRFVHVSTAAAVGAVRRKKNGAIPFEDLLVRESTEFNLGHLRIPYIMTKRSHKYPATSKSCVMNNIDVPYLSFMLTSRSSILFLSMASMELVGSSAISRSGFISMLWQIIIL